MKITRKIAIYEWTWDPVLAEASKLAPMLTETEIIDFVTTIMPARILFISGTSFGGSKNIVKSNKKPKDDIPINSKVPIAASTWETESSPNGLSSSLWIKDK